MLHYFFGKISLYVENEQVVLLSSKLAFFIAELSSSLKQKGIAFAMGDMQDLPTTKIWSDFLECNWGQSLVFKITFILSLELVDVCSFYRVYY